MSSMLPRCRGHASIGDRHSGGICRGTPNDAWASRVLIDSLTGGHSIEFLLNLSAIVPVGGYVYSHSTRFSGILVTSLHGRALCLDILHPAARKWREARSYDICHWLLSQLSMNERHAKAGCDVVTILFESPPTEWRQVSWNEFPVGQLPVASFMCTSRDVNIEQRIANRHVAEPAFLTFFNWTWRPASNNRTSQLVGWEKRYKTREDVCRHLACYIVKKNVGCRVEGIRFEFGCPQ